MIFKKLKRVITAPIMAFISLLFIAPVSTINAQQKTKHMENAKITGYAPVNGLNMYYEIYGEGSMPLVLIHGGGSTIESTFSKMLPPLSAHGKVIAVELQAHGRTSDRDAPESFAQDADDVAGLLKHLKIDKANIFGFSNGGSTAMQIAIRHPNVVNKMIVAAGAYKRDGFIPGFFDFMPNATLDNMPAPLKAAYLKVAPDPEKLQVMFNKDKERMITFKDWPDSDLQAIKAPAMIMVGDHDVITVEHSLQITRLIPGAQLVVLPGTHGDFIGEAGAANQNSNQPAITAALVADFFK